MLAFSSHRLSSFAGLSCDAQHLSNQGRDYSFGGGVRGGALAEILHRLRAFPNKSRIFMTPFHDYAGLFAEKGSFYIPESINGGLAWEINDSFTTAFDVEHIRYSSVKSVGNALLLNLTTTNLRNHQDAVFRHGGFKFIFYKHYNYGKFYPLFSIDWRNADWFSGGIIAVV